MIINFFNQTKEWSNFWLQANSGDKNHDIHYFSNQFFAAYIYQYPLIGNLKFWYIPRAFIVKNDDNFNPSDDEKAKLIIDLLKTIENEAKKNKIIFLKLDFNTNPEFNGIATLLGSLDFRIANRKIQYTKTKILDLSQLQSNGETDIKTTKNYKNKHI